jgi:hypothetical protein
MNESLVEWTLLREQNYLNKCLGLGVKKKIFQQYSTEYGRIDFAHELNDGRIAITELETVINNKSKLEYYIVSINVLNMQIFDLAQNINR